MPFINDMLSNRENHSISEEPSNEVSPSNLPPSSVFPFVFDPDTVMKFLHSRIIGQDEVLNSIEKTLKHVKSNIGAKDKPLAVHLFIGSTGVGKTEIVRLLAKAIRGSEDTLCRIDMNTLAQEHYAAAITGAPPGYVGSKEGVNIFDEESAKGNYSKPGIVLFDELEKADKSVIRSLMGILERGTLKLTSGNKTLDFRNSMVFMTSNIGAKDIWNYQNSWFNRVKSRIGIGGEKKIWERALQSCFDPEFLNRIDKIHYFNDIDENFFTQIVDIEIEKMNIRLRSKGIHVQLTEKAKNSLSHKENLKFGARAIERLIRVDIEPVVAEYIISHIADGKKLIIDHNKEQTGFFIKNIELIT